MKRLIYGYDPLCGWCYGLLPSLRRLRAEMPGLRIKPVMGGLVTGSRIGRYADMEGHIRGASQRMTQVTGMALSPAFFERILGNPDRIASSLIPCAAVLQVRQTAPDRAAEFASALLMAHFAEGDDLNDISVLQRVANEMGLELGDIDPDPHKLTTKLAQEFAATRGLGIDSYPTLIAEENGQQTRLPTSYDPEEVVRTVRSALHLTAPDA
jgi:putative protein-disulfide isomerase